MLTRTAIIDKAVAACVAEEVSYLPADTVSGSGVMEGGRGEELGGAFGNHLVPTSEADQTKRFLRIYFISWLSSQGRCQFKINSLRNIIFHPDPKMRKSIFFNSVGVNIWFVVVMDLGLIVGALIGYFSYQGITIILIVHPIFVGVVTSYSANRE